MKQALLGCGFAAMLMTNAEATCENKMVSAKFANPAAAASQKFAATVHTSPTVNPDLQGFRSFEFPGRTDFFGVGNPSIKIHPTKGEIKLSFVCDPSHESGACARGDRGHCPAPAARTIVGHPKTGKDPVNFCVRYRSVTDVGHKKKMIYELMRGQAANNQQTCNEPVGAPEYVVGNLNSEQPLAVGKGGKALLVQGKRRRLLQARSNGDC